VTCGFKGGQGRTPQSVRDDGSAVCFSLLAAVAVLVSLLAKGCVS
jgi:hypothetical protein